MQRTTERRTHGTQQLPGEANEAMLRCIENCQDCHDICMQTVTWSLEQGGEHAEAENIRAMLDCAEMCQTAANFMTRGSSLHGLTCYVCAVICEQCAEQCERFAEHMPAMSCAEMCRECAESCYEMAETAGVSGEEISQQADGSYIGEALEEVAEGVREEQEQSRSGL